MSARPSDKTVDSKDGGSAKLGGPPFGLGAMGIFDRSAIASKKGCSNDQQASWLTLLRSKAF